MSWTIVRNKVVIKKVKIAERGKLGKNKEKLGIKIVNPVITKNRCLQNASGKINMLNAQDQKGIWTL